MNPQDLLMQAAGIEPAKPKDKARKLAAVPTGHVDRTDHPTVVEYGVQEMMKRKSPLTAARNTAKKLSGYPNMLLGAPADPVYIDPRRLEQLLFDRIVEQAQKNVRDFKPGAEDMAIGAAIDLFRQGKAVEKKVRKVLKVASDRIKKAKA